MLLRAVEKPLTPVSSEPSPLNCDAVTTPVNTAAPLSYIVAPVPIGVSAPRTLIPAISIPILCKLEVPVLTVVSSITTVPVPTERIPVTLASSFTIKSVVAPPTTTSPIVVTPAILTLS